LGNLLADKDIKILNEGQQIRKYILKEYYTINHFYKQNNITKPSLKSLKSYLSSDKVSETFKILTVSLLKKNWNEIVKTKEEQIQHYVNDVTDNINLYTRDVDIHMLEKLKNISKPYTTLYVTMYRNIGMYYYNAFQYNDAVANILLALELLNNSTTNINLIISLYIDLLTIYFRERVFDKTMKIFNEINIIVSNNSYINSKLLFRLWYVLGQLFRNDMENMDNVIAKTMFDRALKLSITNIEKGNTYLQIALIYKKDGDFNKAIKYYQIAQKTYDKDDSIRQSIILNNLADLYKTTGDYSKALTLIEEALLLISFENMTDKTLIFLTTKLEIVKDVDDRKIIMKKIENILLSDINSFNKNFIIKSLDILINVAETLNDYEIIKSLIFIIEQFINNFSGNICNKKHSFIHTNFVRLLENHRNRLVYLIIKKGGNKLEKPF
jgi:tetratricopeptide (TPR) repeat protein